MSKKIRRAKIKKGAVKLFANQQQVNSLYEQGFAHYQAGHLKEAEECCRAVLATNKHHPDALHLLGMTRHQQGDDLKGIYFIKKAIASAPDKFFYHLNLGNIYFSAKNHPEAEICYRKALELNPNFVSTIIHLAKNLEHSQRRQEAFVYYKKALTIEPNHPSALTGLGNALLAAGMIEESIATLRKLVNISPNSAEAHYNLGGALRDFGDVEEAATQFRKALQLRPDFTEAYYNLELVLEVSLEPNQPLPETIRFYKKALTTKSNDPIALTGLGNALLEMGMIEESISTMCKLVKTAPESAEAHYNLGRVLMGCIDMEGAAASYEQALAIRPDYAKAHLNLGITRKAQGRVAEAIASFKDALACKPDYPVTATYLAIFAWVNGEWPACRNYLDLISSTADKLSRKDFKFIVPYLTFLENLLKYREANASHYITDATLPIIHVVGDSHCLSPANTAMTFRGVEYRAEAKIIIGCKAWHLANNDKNKYKYEFEKKIESIPPGASAILMFGEIDCRPDEGIIKHYKKNKTDLAKSIISLVNNYCEYLLARVELRGIIPIICNVPARLIGQDDDVSEPDKKLLKNILQIFNRALADNATKKQIPLLDVYAFSISQEEGPANECHIDNNHLKPSVIEYLVKGL